MKINSANRNVTNTENLYKNFKQKFDSPNASDHQLSIPDLKSLHISDSQSGITDSVLSDKEIDVLKLLFGENQKNDEMHFYGNKKPKNVNSGHFLDVKG